MYQYSITVKNANCYSTQYDHNQCKYGSGMDVEYSSVVFEMCEDWSGKKDVEDNIVVIDVWSKEEECGR